MIVRMTGLYTRLVTYTRLYILTLVVPFYHDISYISFITVLLILIFSVIFYFSIRMLLFTFFYARALFLYTHSLGRFWRPWICTSRYWMFYALVQVFVELVRFARSWSLSLLIMGIHALYSCYFLILSIVFSCLFFPSFICYHCVRYLYVIL